MNHSLDRSISVGMLCGFHFPPLYYDLYGLYSTVDGVFVSRLVGTDAFRLFNIVMPLINLSLAIGPCLEPGGSAIVAKKMGEERIRRPARICAAQSDRLCVSIICSALGLIFLEPLLRFLGSDDSSSPMLGLCGHHPDLSALFHLFHGISDLHDRSRQGRGLAWRSRCWAASQHLPGLYADCRL